MVQISSKHVAYVMKCSKVVSDGNLKFKFVLLEIYFSQFYQVTWRHTEEHSHPQRHRRQNLRPHILMLVQVLLGLRFLCLGANKCNLNCGVSPTWWNVIPLSHTLSLLYLQVVMFMMRLAAKLCHGSGGYSPVSRQWGQGLIPHQSVLG